MPPTFMTDGLSNTIAASEILIGDGSREVKRGIATGFAQATLQTNPGICYTAVAPDGRNYSTSYGLAGNQGRFWAYYLGQFFGTIIAPNGPGCCYGCWGGRGVGVSPPTSNHPGGVNGVMADASTRFISETIDCGNLSSPEAWYIINTIRDIKYDGKSPYGVWGAMGTVAGGESRPSE